ncbi:hypothetical protein C2E20_0092 [Micractinium conductrix]|uniref:DUF1995 domain-containing protein n=1 Tax=Micractinium conductrix TaxID=554055 RepID=A0A2P6VQ51_9CHLO|nr:hypothetical protein C2E20_0092 [Micractinium conductrix]|eukprot:PSC76209.1 hypothetical protein C2E20_0092 [Micractinium conductrix]
MPAIAAVAQCATPSAAAAVAARRCRLRRPVAFAAVSSRAGARRQRPASTRASSGAAEPGPEPAAAGGRQQAAALGPRDDDVLPDSLTGALEDSSQATVEALERGVDRCIVEILLPELWDPLSGPVYAEEGDQQRFWKLTRRFLDNLAALQPDKRIRAVYPDVGVAAMLKNQWTDAAFGFASLNDRTPVVPQDDIIVLAAPDPQGAEEAIRISQGLAEGQSIVMFNPRLASGDVGVGLSIRRMRENFLSRFTTTYSLRPIADVGSVFRRYPGMWQVFVQDEVVTGRYKLVAERLSRPGGEALDYILMDAFGGPAEGEGGAGGATGFINQLGLTLSGLQRFMRSLSQ